MLVLTHLPVNTNSKAPQSLSTEGVFQSTLNPVSFLGNKVWRTEKNYTLGFKLLKICCSSPAACKLFTYFISFRSVVALHYEIL